jgi:hypothetical protein
MKDPQLALRTAYYDALNNTMGLVVYDSLAPSTAASNYILITNQTGLSNNPKMAFQTIVAITVDIVTSYPRGTGGKKVSEQVGNEVLKVILPASIGDYLDISPDFKIVNTSVLSSNSLVEEYETEWVFRKVITFQHSIVQLTND